MISAVSLSSYLFALLHCMLRTIFLKQDWAYMSKGMTDLNCVFAKQASSNDAVTGRDTDSDQCLNPTTAWAKDWLSSDSASSSMGLGLALTAQDDV